MNKNKTTLAICTIAIVAALLITAAAMSSDNAFAKYKKKTQTMAQANACGNGPLPLGIFCQNAASQVQGSDNLATVTASQP